MIRLSSWILAMLLSGCKTLPALNQTKEPVPLSTVHGWIAQQHWIQAMDALILLSQQPEVEVGVWRALGEVHWRLGNQAMASHAALQPNAPELERLGQYVFELEDWLDEHPTRFPRYTKPVFSGGHHARSAANHAPGLRFDLGPDSSRLDLDPISPFK